MAKKKKIKSPTQRKYADLVQAHSLNSLHPNQKISQKNLRPAKIHIPRRPK
jgi:hypothetical protein